MLGEAFPVSDGHRIALIRYVYQVHRLLENTSTSAPFRPFLQYLQNYSSCYVKLAFMLKKKEIYKKSTQNIMKHCPEICAKSWKSISLFLTQLLNYYIELKSVNSWSFIHVHLKAAAESASVVTSRLWSRLKVTVYGLKQSESAQRKGLGSELEMNHKQLHGSSLGGTEIYIF